MDLRLFMFNSNDGIGAHITIHIDTAIGELTDSDIRSAAQGFADGLSGTFALQNLSKTVESEVTLNG